MMESARIIVLTPDELTGIIDQAIERFVAVMDARKQPRRTVNGVSGIASIFGCSYSTAQRIKKSGIINDAISQHERTIVTDVDRALELYHKFTNK